MIVHMIGNAHLQPAGAWSYEAGRDEAMATLRSATERCEEYPDFKFTFGDVWALKVVELLDPSLFKRIRRLAKKGQWSIAQGTYGQSDPHLITDAMWKRQVWTGHRYCLSRFGTQPQVAMNLEARSFPMATCRQLLDAGYQAMVYVSNEAEEAVAGSSIFRWRCDSERELICYRLHPHYRTRSHELYGQIMESVEAGNIVLAHALCFYGVGNHGGGPTKENIEYIRSHREAFENVELKFSTLEDFFAHAILMSDSFPVHEGPIGAPLLCDLLNHRRLQVQQRKVESMLEQVEQLSELRGDRAMVKKVENGLDDLWQDLMDASHACLQRSRLRFEDVEDLETFQLRVARTARDWMYGISRSWVRKHLEPLNYQQLIVMQSRRLAQEVWIEHEPNLDFDPWGKRQLCDSEGNPVPFDLLPSTSGDPRIHRLLFRAKIPESGVARYLLREFPDILVDAGGVEPVVPEGHLRVLKTTIENDHWCLRVSPRSINRIAPMRDREMNLLGKLGMSLTLYEDRMDAGVLDRTSGPQVYGAGVESDGWEIVEEGRLRVGMVNRGRIGNSPFEWHLQLSEGDPRIYQTLRIAYVEPRHHLELNLYLDQEVPQWLDAAGTKPELRDSGGAVYPFHGWTRAHGSSCSLALISTDALAIRHEAQCLSLLLLRSPQERSGQPTERPSLSVAGDLGVHTFRWVLCPEAQWGETELKQEYERLQFPAMVWDSYEGLRRPAWENSTPYHLQESNEHRARADGQMRHLASAPEGKSSETRP